MEKKNIHYTCSGFLKGVEYHADMLQFLYRFEDKFGHAEYLTVSLDELGPYQSDMNREQWLIISDDGKSIDIKLTATKYYDYYGKLTGTPDEYEIYRRLKDMMEIAVERYAKKFPTPME